MLKLLQLRLREVLHLAMQELFRISTFSEVKDAPFIRILEDEPFISFEGFIVSVSFHHT